jgi:hypothetical protein
VSVIVVGATAASVVAGSGCTGRAHSAYTVIAEIAIVNPHMVGIYHAL